MKKRQQERKKRQWSYKSDSNWQNDNSKFLHLIMTLNINGLMSQIERDGVATMTKGYATCLAGVAILISDKLHIKQKL